MLRGRMLLDLRIYKLAKSASKDMPEAIKALDKAAKQLSPHAKYRAVANAVSAILQQKAYLQQQLKLANDTVTKKARVK